MESGFYLGPHVHTNAIFHRYKFNTEDVIFTHFIIRIRRSNKVHQLAYARPLSTNLQLISADESFYNTQPAFIFYTRSSVMQ